MAWGVFKKIRDGIKKAARWIKDKVVPAVKPLINTAIKLAPAIGGAIATSQGAPPQSGMAAGTAIQSIGKSLGFG